jgi:tetratricopeptide (TPR) repeat protein
MAACAVFALLSGILSFARAQDDVVLNRYLERLKLTELRITLAEKAVKQQQNPTSTEAVAERKRLGDLYLRWMSESGDSEKTFARAKQRATEFFDKNPAIRTPELELVLIESDFDRLVTLFTDSVDRPKSGDGNRAKAHEAFTKIAASLLEKVTAFEKEMQAEIDKEPESTGAFPFGGGKFGAKKDAPVIDDPMVAKEKLVLRSKYFAAWAQYYAAVSSPGKSGRTKQLSDARRLFCEILSLDHEQETLKLDPESLNLEVVPRARTLQGIAMCDIAMGDHDDTKDSESRTAISALEHAATASVVRDQLANIRLQAYWNAGRDKEAPELVETTLARYPKSPMPGTVPMCIALVRRGQAEASPGELSVWTKLGLSGFLRMNAMEAAGSVIAKFDLDLGNADDFQLLRLFGKQAFADAEKSKDTTKYRSATTALEKALKKPEATSDLDATADIRFTLAWCHFRLNEVAEAQRMFLQSSRVLKRSNDPRAVQAAWMAFVCALKQAESKEAGAVEEARRIGLDLKRDFPTSEQAKKVDYMNSRLGKTAEVGGNVDELKKVQPSSPNYQDARYELAHALMAKFREAKPEEKLALRTEIVEVVEGYLAKAPVAQAERRIRAGLLIVEAFADNPNAPEVTAALKRAEADMKKLEAGSSVMIEWQYRQMLRAQAAGDAARTLELAKEIAKSGQGTHYELAAILVLAKQADRDVAAAPAASKREKTLAAIEIYRRLVSLLGDDEESLKAKKNAMTAAAKLAQYEADLEMWGEAGARFASLLAAAPNDAGILRMAAACLTKSREYAKALPLCQRLLSAHSQDSPAWLEAKYYQLVCLQNTDMPTAKAAYKQFKLLYPMVKDPEWKPKFDALDKVLGGA